MGRVIGMRGAEEPNSRARLLKRIWKLTSSFRSLQRRKVTLGDRPGRSTKSSRRTLKENESTPSFRFSTAAFGRGPICSGPGQSLTGQLPERTLSKGPDRPGVFETQLSRSHFKPSVPERVERGPLGGVSPTTPRLRRPGGTPDRAVGGGGRAEQPLAKARDTAPGPLLPPLI